MKKPRYKLSKYELFEEIDNKMYLLTEDNKWVEVRQWKDFTVPFIYETPYLQDILLFLTKEKARLPHEALPKIIIELNKIKKDVINKVLQETCQNDE